MELNPGSRVLLGVSAGIAAYKSVDLVRRIKERGAEVRVVMTEAAAAFVAPLTFQAVSGHPVRTTLLDPGAEAGMGHIELARWADRLLIAPATADVMARLAAGLANDLLTTVALACEAPLFIAPAMNQAMWRHPATQQNLETLRARGVHVLGPGVGEQACGDLGPGRMGFALADALEALGARVTLITGPTSLPGPRVTERVDVETALEMHGAVMSRATEYDIFVATAAVADYRSAAPAENKIKKNADELTLRLVRNPDILAEVAALPHPPFTVGFAAETDRVEEYARDKLNRKGLNMIAANHVGGAQGGFERAENALTVIWHDGQRELPMMDKTRLARELAALIAERYQEHHAASS